MKFRLQEIEQLSGRRCKIYSIKAIRNKDLRWNRKGDDFEGQLYFDSDDY